MFSHAQDKRDRPQATAAGDESAEAGGPMERKHLSPAASTWPVLLLQHPHLLYPEKEEGEKRHFALEKNSRDRRFNSLMNFIQMSFIQRDRLTLEVTKRPFPLNSVEMDLQRNKWGAQIWNATFFLLSFFLTEGWLLYNIGLIYAIHCHTSHRWTYEPPSHLPLKC